MNARYALLTLLLSVALYTSAMACGGGGGCSDNAGYDACGDSSGCGTYDGCGNYAGGNDCCDTGDRNCQYGSTGYQHAACDCDCDDGGWRYNDCISRGRYCEAFGNIGER